MYVLVIRQTGGCDYTIGCGTKLIPLDAQDIEDAEKEVDFYIGNNWDVGTVETFKSAKIMDVRELHDFDITKLQKKLREQTQAVVENMQYARYLKMKEGA